MGKISSNISNRCSGCTACVFSCPTHAISIRKDKKGFDVPDIEEEKCIDCGKCFRVCHLKSRRNSINVNKGNFNIYAAYMDDDNMRFNSSSGAVFPALAEAILKDGGYVCGCILEKKDMTVKHVVTRDCSIINRMSDSKYVQSSLYSCFEIIADLLKNEHMVLFSGTSCQVAGLKNLLSEKNIQDNSLVTVDLICHGTPSPLIFKEYLKFYEKETGHSATDMRFRSKKYGWGVADLPYIQRVFYKEGEDDTTFASRLWHNCFFSDLCLRKCCYSCAYASYNKPADITIADFWGINGFMPEMNDGKGCSLVITHNDKGKYWINKSGVKKKEYSDMDKVCKIQMHLYKSADEPVEYENFWNDFFEEGFEYVASKYLRYNVENTEKYREKRALLDENWKAYVNTYPDLLL